MLFAFWEENLAKCSKENTLKYVSKISIMKTDSKIRQQNKTVGIFKCNIDIINLLYIKYKNIDACILYAQGSNPAVSYYIKYKNLNRK